MDFLHHPDIERIIRQAFDEDIKTGDITTLSTVPADVQSAAKCLIKAEGILAGVDFALKVFSYFDEKLEVEVFLQDGAQIKKGDIAFIVRGSARSILQCERLVLNVMQRMSAIATQTRKVVDLLAGTGCQVLDTRKTTPGIRILEKWAVKIGGGTNHRFGLYDMVMIKDNHVDYAGSITAAVKACQAYLQEKQLQVRIEVETRNLTEVEEALAVGGVDVIMLDNMDIPTMTEAVKRIGTQCQSEASGGINMETCRGIAETGVTYISMGALTHSVEALDISLKAIK